MKITRSRCLILSFALVCGLVPEVTADVEEATDGLSTTQEPIWLTDVPATVELIAAAEVAVIGFFQDLEIPIVSVFRSMARQFQDVSFGISNHSEVLTHYNVTSNSIYLFRLVDNQQLHLDAGDIENLDAAKLSRFIHMNNLHWVTEYSPMVAAGLFNTMVQTHLLLMMKKTSPEYEESMHRYREAAKLFQGQDLSWTLFFHLSLSRECGDAAGECGDAAGECGDAAGECGAAADLDHRCVISYLNGLDWMWVHPLQISQDISYKHDFRFQM
ncbi:endoplasmic reticulum resident protein 27 [Mus caroli]|uniref:Endoplasmic reticulum resident protein 27 n=1 Tax=Mus caroli TaxID=10089 RepID=A0A6P5PNV8_MUSCR|nr:endoplasmic reticulum resident protein 27 [Mus caroli]